MHDFSRCAPSMFYTGRIEDQIDRVAIWPFRSSRDLKVHTYMEWIFKKNYDG